MRLLFFVMNKTDKLEKLLTEFLQAGIKGATVLSSTGMARVLTNHDDEEDIPFLGSLRAMPVSYTHRDVYKRQRLYILYYNGYNICNGQYMDRR